MKIKKEHTLFMALYALLLLLLAMMACTLPNSTPKTKGYSRVELPSPVYSRSTDSLPFSFELSDQAKLSWQKNKPGEYFCDVIYPVLNARLYCTFHVITPSKLQQFAEESHKMAYQHTVVATGIKENLIANNRLHVYGILYDIQGNVATPLQLSLTDSVHYYFNASLYFNAVPNADSIAPVLKYIRQDVLHLMNTFTLKPR